MSMELDYFIDQQKKEILQTYQELHQLAEPSWKEEKTSAYIKNKLLNAGLNVRTFDEHFGLVAEIKGMKEEVISIRADMDALVQEVDGVVRSNHSCGHDAHSTMALFTAITLREHYPLPTNTIRIIFQPAEEKAEGALQMLKDGVLQNVKFLGGIHLRPVMEIPFSKAAPVILHGSTACIKGVIKGFPAHAARPEAGNNPIEAAALLIQAIKKLRIKSDFSYSIKMTELHAGESSNSIPETARFTLDLRAASNDLMSTLIEEAQHIIQTVSKLTETEIESGVEEYSPAAVKNDEGIRLAEKAIVSVLGEENLVPSCVSPGAEDFHFYTLKNPALSATMIGLGCDLKPGLHHPNMTFNSDALLYGIKILTQLLIEADRKQW
ncbi:amidohydrolase [Alkalihalobacillus sp. BA299]|uniref:amidohydrolase n=1 Tax=Alkalihalobacillus sp. BA299 TaxID=2815938 RepID=UPI001ADABF4F|nr:amidohydrolase [Alkalihalobacillus sp. BA299]